MHALMCMLSSTVMFLNQRYKHTVHHSVLLCFVCLLSSYFWESMLGKLAISIEVTCSCLLSSPRCQWLDLKYVTAYMTLQSTADQCMHMNIKNHIVLCCETDTVCICSVQHVALRRAHMHS